MTLRRGSPSWGLTLYRVSLLCSARTDAQGSLKASVWPEESCRFAPFKPIRRLRSPVEPPAAAATGRPSPRSGRGAGAELSVTATGVSAAHGAQAQRVAHAEKVCAPTRLCDLRTAHFMRVELNDTWHARCVHVTNTRMNPRCDATHAWNARAYLARWLPLPYSKHGPNQKPTSSRCRRRSTWGSSPMLRRRRSRPHSCSTACTVCRRS